MSKFKLAYAILFALALGAGCQKAETTNAEAPVDAAIEQNAEAENTPSALEVEAPAVATQEEAPALDAPLVAPEGGEAADVPALELENAPAAAPSTGGLQLQLGGQGGGFDGNQPRLNLNRSF